MIQKVIEADPPVPYRVYRVLTLACGHLWSWRGHADEKVPKAINCPHCDINAN